MSEPATVEATPEAFKPRRKVLVVLMVVFAVWLAFLIYLSATT